jgi:hypothetical protein
MKFNWGTGIALVYGAFALGMIALVFASRQHDPGLVQKDYYALDLNYQGRLDGKQNVADMAVPPQVTLAGADKSLTIQFPPGMEAAQGSAKLFRSITINDDISTKFENGQPIQLSTEKMAPGRWHVELEWEVTGKKYFWETAVVIPG